MRPAEPADLHGNAPDKCAIALVLVDVINDFDFPTGDQLRPRAARAARQLAALKAKARRAGVPCIYVNDNYGRWRSDFHAQVDHCIDDETPGKAIAELLRPTPEDYFVLKPKHSAFYQTCMSTLLDHLGTESIVIAGFATDSCVLFSATDAFLRGYALIVPRDGCAADDARSHASALRQMERSLRARTPRCAEIGFARGPKGALRLRLTRAGRGA